MANCLFWFLQWKCCRIRDTKPYRDVFAPKTENMWRTISALCWLLGYRQEVRHGVLIPISKVRILVPQFYAVNRCQKVDAWMHTISSTLGRSSLFYRLLRRKSPFMCRGGSFVMVRCPSLVYGVCLENRCAETHRGFKSYSDRLFK